MSADNHDMNYSAETFVVSGGRPAHEHDAPVNPPIVLSSTYRGVDAVNIEQDRVYARFSNPTWEGMEEVVAKLENATRADSEARIHGVGDPVQGFGTPRHH